MARWTMRLLLLVGGLLRVSPAHAIAASFTELPLDGLIVRISNSLINTWIPFLALAGLVSVAVAIGLGAMHWSAKVAKYCVSMALLSVGLPGMSAIFGGQIATSVVGPW